MSEIKSITKLFFCKGTLAVSSTGVRFAKLHSPANLLVYPKIRAYSLAQNSYYFQKRKFAEEI
jgi:hypothetical protein